MCISPIMVPVRDKCGRLLEYRYVPCRKCGQCLKSSRFQWSNRLLAESMKSIDNFFITLTYDEVHLPYFDKFSCFCKKHLQDYFKRLRKFFSFRYFAVSEYGEDYFRPHYHCIMFVNNSSFSIDSIRQLIINEWFFGHVDIGFVSMKSINYCTYYMLNPNSLYFNMLESFFNCKYDDLDSCFKPFMICSKKPILGDNLLEMFLNSNGSIPFNGTIIKPVGSFSSKCGFPNGNVKLNEFGLTDESYIMQLNVFLHNNPKLTVIDFNKRLSSFNRSKFKINNSKHGL